MDRSRHLGVGGGGGLTQKGWTMEKGGDSGVGRWRRVETGVGKWRKVAIQG